MIYLSETEVFKRKVPKALYRLVGREFATANCFKQLANGFGIQGSVTGLFIIVQ